MPIDEEDVRNVLQKTQALNWTIDVLRDFCHIEMEFSQSTVGVSTHKAPLRPRALIVSRADY